MTIAGLADEELARWVESTRAAPAPFPPDLEAMRAPRQRTPGPSVARVEDLVVPGDPPVVVRSYRPAQGSLPVTVFVHGGLFVSGDLESHDRTCRRLALGARTVVLAVDHRRAPEHPTPAAIDDVVAVCRYAGGRVALAGDSSGGLIAVLASLALAREGVPVRALWLACPNADLTLSLPSVEARGAGWGLDARAVRWGAERWLGCGSLEEFSPLHADLTGAPPAVVAVAEHDPLADEGRALAQRLPSAGLVEHPGLVHGFLSLDDVSPAARRAGDALIERLGHVLAS